MQKDALEIFIFSFISVSLQVYLITQTIKSQNDQEFRNLSGFKEELEKLFRN